MTLTEIKNYLTEAKKTVITALGVIVAVGAPIVNEYASFLPAKDVAAISTVVGLATIALNYLAPNETAIAHRVAGRSVRLKGQKPHKVAPKA